MLKYVRVGVLGDVWVVGMFKPFLVFSFGLIQAEQIFLRYKNIKESN